MKLVTQYNRFTLPILVLIFLLSSLVSYFLVRRVLLKELDETITRAGKVIRTYAKEHDKIPELVQLSNQTIEFKKVSSPIADTGFLTVNPIIPGPKKQHLFRKLVFQLPVDKELYRVSISSPLEGASQLTAILLTITISTVLVIILISLFLNHYILAKLLLPFYTSLDVLRSFRIDKPSPLSFPETSTDEFKFMIDSLKAATLKEAEKYQSLKEFTENASHEIQTPLAIIRSKLDILIQKEGLSEHESETSNSAYSAIDKLSNLSKSLLLITKIENQKFDGITTIDLRQKVTDKLFQFQELWQINNIEITSELHKAEIVANEDLTDILLNNLLSNATKHNTKNGKINIGLAQGCLTVNNTGIESPLDSTRLFERFYKGTQYSDSNGLGLTIVKQICDISGISASYQYSGDKHVFMLEWQPRLNYP